MGGDHADRAKVVFATLDHLDVVAAGQLRVDAAGMVGGAVKGGPQQPVAGLADGLALAVGVAGFGRFGGKAGEGAELPSGGEAVGISHGGRQGGAADLGQAGQAAGQPCWVDPAVAVLPLGGVAGQLGLGKAQQPDLGLDLGQISEGDGGWSGYSSAAARAAASHWVARWAPWWPPEALAISRASRAGPAASRRGGRRRCVPAPPGRPCPAPLSAGWWAAAAGPGP
jgi:hypothetical protein